MTTQSTSNAKHTTKTSVEVYTSDSSSYYGAPVNHQHSSRHRTDKKYRARSASHHRSHKTHSPHSTSDDYVPPIRSNYQSKNHTYEQVDESQRLPLNPIYSPPPVHYDKLKHHNHIDSLRNNNYHPIHRH